MKKKSIYGFDFTSNMIGPMIFQFSQMLNFFLLKKKENGEISYKHPDLIRRPKCDGFWKKSP